MRKTLATLAWAAIPAVLISFSACSGSSGTNTGVAPLPNSPDISKHGRVHRDVSANLHAGGATFPGYGYNLGVQPVGTPGPYGSGQATPGPGSVLAAADATFSDGANTYYCLTGSGYGRAEFEANNGTATSACAILGASPSGFGAEQDPLDFVGSDVAMPSTECCASGTTYYTGRLTGSTTWGQPFEFPTFGGPIVFGYVHSSFTGLKSTQSLQLSTWTYCAIVNGTVGNWDDPAITADNGGKSVTGGDSEPIDFYYRSDSSGTSYLFQYKLSNSTSGCNQTFGSPYNAPPYGSASRSAAWTGGYGMHWNGPTGGQPSGSTFTPESGNPGVLAGIQSDATGFGTGYVEGAWAASTQGENPPVAQASVQNGFKKGVANFISPTSATAVADALKNVTGSSIQYGEGSNGDPLASSAPWCQLYVPPSVFVSPKLIQAYPIVGLSYFMFYGKNNGIHVADKIALVKYIANTSTIADVLAPLEYTPLGPSIGKRISGALNGSGKKKPACLQ
jgi:ABC-type phosphate transport system substrate-binding protein